MWLRERLGIGIEVNKVRLRVEFKWEIGLVVGAH